MMITSYAIGWNAGQNLVLENVSGMADRLLPFGSDTGSSGLRPHAVGSGITASTIDGVLGYLDNDTTFSPNTGNVDLPLSAG